MGWQRVRTQRGVIDHRQSLRQLSEHLERCAPRPDDDGGPELGDRDAVCRQLGADRMPTGQVVGEPGVVVAEATEVHDASDPGGRGRARECTCRTQVAFREPGLSGCHRMRQVVRDVDARDRRREARGVEQVRVDRVCSGEADREQRRADDPRGSGRARAPAAAAPVAHRCSRSLRRPGYAPPEYAPRGRWTRTSVQPVRLRGRTQRVLERCHWVRRCHLEGTRRGRSAQVGRRQFVNPLGPTQGPARRPTTESPVGCRRVAAPCGRPRTIGSGRSS